MGKTIMKIKINLMSGGLGDQVCVEPIIRFALEQYYKELMIDTDYPEVFEHLRSKGLSINSKDQFDFLIDCNPYVRTDTGWEIHPFCKYIHHATLHPLDFTSLFVLRQGLPDKYRSIQLTVDENVASNILKQYPNIRDTWLIHPGYGAPLKSFGEQYWVDVVSLLKKESIPMISIGKTREAFDVVFGSYNTGTDVNLIDKLGTTELIALISLAKGILCNDCGPMHIAGAFDNNIIVIPTIKHADFILPYRHGNKYHKAVALTGSIPFYNYYDFAPHSENYSCIGEVIRPLDVALNLPTPEQILKSIKDTT